MKSPSALTFHLHLMLNSHSSPNSANAAIKKAASNMTRLQWRLSTKFLALIFTLKFGRCFIHTIAHIFKGFIDIIQQC